MEGPSPSPSLIFSRSAGPPSSPSTMGTRSCPAPWAPVSGAWWAGTTGGSGLPIRKGWGLRKHTPAATLLLAQGWGTYGQVLLGVPPLRPLTPPPLSGDCYELHVHCKTSFVGYFPATVLWELLGPGEPGSEGAGTFYIARFLAAVAHSPLAAQLKPTTPFKRPRITGNPVVTSRIEEGERPDR